VGRKGQTLGLMVNRGGALAINDGVAMRGRCWPPMHTEKGGKRKVRKGG